MTHTTRTTHTQALSLSFFISCCPFEGMGIVFLCWSCALLSFHLLSRCANMTGLYSYKEISIEAFGDIGNPNNPTIIILVDMLYPHKLF